MAPSAGLPVIAPSERIFEVKKQPTQSPSVNTAESIGAEKHEKSSASAVTSASSSPMKKTATRMLASARENVRPMYHSAAPSPSVISVVFTASVSSSP